MTFFPLLLVKDVKINGQRLYDLHVLFKIFFFSLLPSFPIYFMCWIRVYEGKSVILLI